MKTNYRLGEIETKFARMTPESDSDRNAELLRFFLASQPTTPPEAELAKAKRQGFLLGGVLGLCVGAIAMFLMLAVFLADMHGEPVVTPSVTPVVPAEVVTEKHGMILAANLQTSMSADAIRNLVPPPSAFWVPFSIAAMSVVLVMLMVRHLRVRFVF